MKTLRESTKNGRPCGDDSFVRKIEELLGRQLVALPRGRPRRARQIGAVPLCPPVLMYNLFKAIPPQTHLILVGDVDQLPSVGPGNVLRDIMNPESLSW